jgi:multicomponent Na+:H+ antiporter subunit G
MEEPAVTAIVVTLLVVLGVGLMLVAGLGIVRMPDLPTRMHASSKAGTLGAALILVAVGVDFADLAVAVRAVLIVGFLFLTAPVASHVIARAAYRTGVPLSDETVVDELARDRDLESERPGDDS